MFSSGNVVVDKLREINFDGNVIPHTWYDQLRKKTKKGVENAPPSKRQLCSIRRVDG